MVVWLSLGLGLEAAELRIHREPGSVAGVGVVAPSNAVAIIEKSSDLGTWTEWQRWHGSVGSVADLTEGQAPASFYRALIRTRTSADDWKTAVAVSPDEVFLSKPPEMWRPAARWIKFVILPEEPGRVYFQDSSRYEYHYDFARVRIPRFQGMTRAAFDAVTLRRAGQQGVLGAVLVPPTPNIREIGIQFVGLEEYPPELIERWFRRVRAAIQSGPGISVLYLPTFEQARAAREHAEWLAERGVPVASAGRWVVGDECYSPGWALGRLVRVPGAGIADAYRRGELGPGDVLLTDMVPSEVPPVAGIVALSPATPNSHVALLSQSFGIPFVHLADPESGASTQSWTNREVVLRAVQQLGGCDVMIAPLDGAMPPGMRASILDLKAPPRLTIPAKARRGEIVVSADGLRPSDIVHVGGKAANFGVVRRGVPTNSPVPAMALTFDVWEEYLDGRLADGRTLRETVASKLGAFRWPPDMAVLETALAEVRELFTDRADFTPAQKTAILAALRQAGFPAGRKVRFRSSTNVEDSGQFSGAGLYDSYSGCPEDDEDADLAGPSACDPGEPKERGVFRALRKVFASFYNGNAFLERLRHGVDETQVGMAVLVHPSVPDPLEQANGVATMRISRSEGRYLSGEIVTQVGAVSVTNPDSTAVPESVAFSQFGTTPFLSVEKRSSLVPLGATVMPWEGEYRRLVSLLDQVALGYESEFPARKEFTLDFEFKRLAPTGQLSIKQVREVPKPPSRTYTPWLLNTPLAWSVLQGEHGGVVTFHRLKSHWQLPVRHTGLRDADLSRSLYVGLSAQWREGTTPVGFAGEPQSLPGYTFRRAPEELKDRWTWGEGAAKRTYELSTSRVGVTDSERGPLVTLADHFLVLSVTHATPQPTLEYSLLTDRMEPALATQETVTLTPVMPLTAESLRQERVLAPVKGGVRVRTSFWWPAPPKGVTAGYTAPLIAWIETVIEGLTTRPLVLRSEWAQTYHPGHHNFFEEFLFEPARDPGVPADLRAELERANVKALILSSEPWEGAAATGWIWGIDDTFRPL
jgi:hypothetical protein